MLLEIAQLGGERIAARSGRQRAQAHPRARPLHEYAFERLETTTRDTRARSPWSRCTSRASRPPRARSAWTCCVKSPRSTRPARRQAAGLRHAAARLGGGLHRTRDGRRPRARRAVWRSGTSCSPRPTASLSRAATEPRRIAICLRCAKWYAVRAPRVRDPVLPADPAARSRATRR